LPEPGAQHDRQRRTATIVRGRQRTTDRGVRAEQIEEVTRYGAVIDLNGLVRAHGARPVRRSHGRQSVKAPRPRAKVDEVRIRHL
jgi:hypothetical protein